MLKLQEFIKTMVNEGYDWQNILSSEPFSLTIKRDGDYVLFAYNMIESNLNLEIVQEARGIIFYEPTWEVVCYPFKKFFNVQESNAAEIDWSTAVVQEKLDGSIIKLWYHNGSWHVSTNGTINAANAKLSMPVDLGYVRLESYFDLFVHAASQYDFIGMLEYLDKDCTYMFELVSPFNRVVVPYSKTEIYHIGTRNNVTLEELDVHIGIKKPVKYGIHYLEQCLEAARCLPFNEEGYVVCDASFNRVKIKGAAYVAAHHLKNNGVINASRILDLIRENGQDDFSSIYPEFKPIIEKVMRGITDFRYAVEEEWFNFQHSELVNASRKDIALHFQKCVCPPAMFALLDKRCEESLDWLFSLPNDKVLKWIGCE